MYLNALFTVKNVVHTISGEYFIFSVLSPVLCKFNRTLSVIAKKVLSFHWSHPKTRLKVQRTIWQRKFLYSNAKKAMNRHTFPAERIKNVLFRLEYKSQDSYSRHIECSPKSFYSNMVFERKKSAKSIIPTLNLVLTFNLLLQSKNDVIVTSKENWCILLYSNWSSIKWYDVPCNTIKFLTKVRHVPQYSVACIEDAKVLNFIWFRCLFLFDGLFYRCIKQAFVPTRWATTMQVDL